ncbi:hypothetical protein LCGC14_1539800 [marine sediment metagenome]|uniref:Uncharacterized protein n=1 Tax=marine sediment metagenome TaxID=412755 RepID=A0A0F9LU57_9ZZZZ
MGLGIMLSYTINFDKEALKNAEKDFKHVKLTTEQLKILQELTKFICEIIKLPEIAIRATIWKALKEWQIKHNKAIEEIPELPVELRLNTIKEIFTIGKNLLKKMVKDSKDKCDIIIDIAFEKSFKYYLKNFE